VIVSAQVDRYIKLINTFKAELERPFVGREEEALVITLALMTAEHAILVGEPGTAKSALARRAADLLKARFFKYLLTKFTEPDELLGPLDIQAFKEGRYARIMKNKLPDAEIAFLDEIFNASSAILNTLLTLLNERVVYDGFNEIKVPVWSVIAASNSVPEDPEYQALYDRFLLRHFVKPVSEDKWERLLDAAWRIEVEGYRASQPVLTMSDLAEIHSLVLKVDVSRIKQVLVKIYAELEDQGVHLTDRRKGKALKVIAAHSLLSGRTVSTEEDLFVLKYVAPHSREDVDKVYAVLLEGIGGIERALRELDEIAMNLRAVKSYVERAERFEPRMIEYVRGLEKARDRVKRIASTAHDERVALRARQLLFEIEGVLERIKGMIVK
jgi:MoxR-like ATPase